MKKRIGFIIMSLSMAVTMGCSDGAARLEGGVSTALWGKNYGAEQLQEALDAGLRHIEVVTNNSVRGVPAQEREASMAAYAASIDSVGMDVWSVHLPFSRDYDISLTEDSLRREAVELIGWVMRKSAELYKPQRFVLHPSYEPIDDAVREERIGSSIASITELQEVARELGVLLCIENLPRTCLGNTPEELVRIVDSVPGVYVCFDTNHYTQGTPEHFIDVVGKRIKTVHISDFDFVDEKHWIAGEGDIEWGPLVQGLIEKAEYQGVLMNEVKKHKDGRQASPAEVMESLNAIY